MRRIAAYLIFSLLFLGLQLNTKAQDILVPAGTLLHCTLDEPNFSSATADIGDPVICHLSSLREFGQNVFPRGSYLGGHLEADKEPGHFVGKGYLKLQFDRIGFPNSDLPVPSKVIAAKGFKVDRHGDIVGHGHATRDIVEWLIPPLWPWKIIMLPARGPRPTLKAEEQITVRLMDDIQVPRLTASGHSPIRPASYERPPAYRPQNLDRPAGSDAQPSFEQAQAVNTAENNVSEVSLAAPSAPAQQLQAEAADPSPVQTEPATSAALQQPRARWIALKPATVYAVSSYHIQNGSVTYVLASGANGSADITAVDWRKTSRLNAAPVDSSTTPRTASAAALEPLSVRP
ncbi:MAG TPA: hypothetical protein VN982_10065 [Candidatus Dormibacteraeota bacterium]|nr:hypothetical protein [Candidatus Dormibacteraeota bacterium]